MRWTKKKVVAAVIGGVPAVLLALAWGLGGFGPFHPTPANSGSPAAANGCAADRPGPVEDTTPTPSPEPKRLARALRVTGAQGCEWARVAVLRPGGESLVLPTTDQVATLPEALEAASRLVAVASRTRKDEQGEAQVVYLRSAGVTLADLPAEKATLQVVPAAWLHVGVSRTGEDGYVAAGDGASIEMGFQDEAQALDWTLAMQAIEKEPSSVLTTDAVGEALIQLLPVGATVSVAATRGIERSETQTQVLEAESGAMLKLRPPAGSATVVFVDRAGNRIPGLALVVENLRPTLRGGMNADGREHVVADANGEAVVRWYEGGAAGIASVSPPWYLPEGPVQVSAFGSRVTVTLGQTMDLVVVVQYPDGELHRGSVHVSSANEQTYMGVDSLDHGGLVPPEPELKAAHERGELLFRGVPSDQPLEIAASTSRPGFASLRQTLAPAEFAGGRVVLVFPRSTSQRRWGRMVFNTSLLPPGKFTAYVFARTEGSPRPYGEFVLSEEKTSSRLHPGTYFVRVFGEGKAWQSQDIEVAGDVDTEVQLRAEATGTVTVRVLDANGLPVAGAVLDLDDRGAPVFPAQAQPGLTAVTDAGGEARLEGLPAGTATYRVEAAGCEPVRREAHVSAGSVVHLGDVRVEPAKGCIVIIVEDWPETEPAKQVRVSVGNAWSFGDVVPEQGVVGGRCEFRNLALGRNFALAFMLQGESESVLCVSNIIATAEQPVQEIRLKMKDLFK